jgi:hypothetical protein
VKKLLVSLALLAVSACGQIAPLRPQAGASLPPKPAAALKTPDADTLMTPSDQSRPRRNDELLQGSDKRVPDKFDLPPSG